MACHIGHFARIYSLSAASVTTTQRRYIDLHGTMCELSLPAPPGSVARLPGSRICVHEYVKIRIPIDASRVGATELMDATDPDHAGLFSGESFDSDVFSLPQTLSLSRTHCIGSDKPFYPATNGVNLGSKGFFVLA